MTWLSHRQADAVCRNAIAQLNVGKRQLPRLDSEFDIAIRRLNSSHLPYGLNDSGKHSRLSLKRYRGAGLAVLCRAHDNTQVITDQLVTRN